MPRKSTQDDIGGVVARRKREHLEHALGPNSQRGAAGWPDVRLVHEALPAVDAADVDLHCSLFGRELRLPLVIAGMTGGHAGALEINRRLASAAEATGVAMGLGSQRAMLVDSALAGTYAVARDAAPSALLIANLGVAQLIDQDGEAAVTMEAVEATVDHVRADALALHLNYLEEAVQLEGQTRADSIEAAIRRVAAHVDLPLLAKETGAGISRSAAERLRDCGVRALDVGGLGGTSFAAIEAARASERGDALRAELGAALDDWGLPTPVAVAGCAPVLPVIATGGIRGGVDAAKAIALGAELVGVGRPLLECAVESEHAVREWIIGFELQLRTAVFLSGGHCLRDLRRAHRVILGDTARWLEQLGHGSPGGMPLF